MKWTLALMLCLMPLASMAQSSDVDQNDVQITVTVEENQITPIQQEMVLITIHGVYRRHITREQLEQPDLEGFNWMQLGQDQWFDSQVDGLKVKNFRRRMALFPERVGTLTIGPFVHHLTLTDEGDDWFAHDIQSEPVTIKVKALPEHRGWWFPARRLEISDQWSNPPDQLQNGEGVLRVIRLSAVGVSPEMMPPMPELSSPSAIIFPHPEQRFVELSPEGPVSFAFWRWTIRPTNDVSAIVEPIIFDYFDTVSRESHEVTISAQRIAMDRATLPPPLRMADSVVLHRGAAIAGAGLAFFLGLAALLFDRRISGDAIRRLRLFDPIRRELRRAGAKGDLPGLRRAAVALCRRDGWTDLARAEISRLDAAIFGDLAKPDAKALSRRLQDMIAKRVDNACPGDSLKHERKIQ